MHSATSHTFFGAHHKNLNKDRPILSAEKCSSEILVLGKFKVYGYSLEFAGDGASNEWGRRNGDFALKSALRSACDGFACSGFRAKLLGDLQSYAYTARAANM